MNKSIEEKFIPYIDQELNQDERMIVDEYLQNNKEANLRFNDLKKSRNFVQEAFNEYKDMNNDKYIDSLIDNYPIKSKNNQFENINLFKKIFKNFSLPNFASGALVAGCISFFALISPLSLQTVAFNKGLDETNTMISVKSKTSQFVVILNQKSTTSVSKKLNDIEKIIQQNRSSNDIGISSSKNLSKTTKIEVIDSNTQSNCINIIINNTSDKTDYTFCKKDDLWKINK